MMQVVQVKILLFNKEIVMLEEIQKYLLKDTKTFNKICNDIWTVVELKENDKLNDVESDFLYESLKQNISEGGRLAIFCLGLLSNILTTNLLDFLLYELQKNLTKSEAITIKIIQVFENNGITDYLSIFNDENNLKISNELSSFINELKNFNKGLIQTIKWPQIYYTEEIEKIDIFWKK